MSGITNISGSTSGVALGTASSGGLSVSSGDVSTVAGIRGQQGQIGEGAVRTAVAQANQIAAESNQRLSFSYDKRAGHMYVQVTDTVTGRVREFPPKPFFDLVTTTGNMSGLFLNRKG
ncbi:MAG TPA: flagellar protein FlaG [Mariprofundaceae bacterium]|nr:flagellar protein FlaG [Mariprofundaceae bacterium]